MGKLLKLLDARLLEKYKAIEGEDLLPLGGVGGWSDVSEEMPIAFGPRQGNTTINELSVYDRTDDWLEPQEHGVLWSIREMFVDVFLSIIDTIEGPNLADIKLVVEPHIISPTRVVVIWKNKFILFNHDYHICHFDFDDAHALEVFMQNVKTFILKEFKEISNE